MNSKKNGRSIPPLGIMLCFSVARSFAAGGCPGQTMTPAPSPAAATPAPVSIPAPAMVAPVAPTATITPVIPATPMMPLPVQPTPTFNPAMTPSPGVLNTDLNRVNTLMMNQSGNTQQVPGANQWIQPTQSINPGELDFSNPIVVNNNQVTSGTSVVKTYTVTNPWLDPYYEAQFNEIRNGLLNKSLNERVDKAKARLDAANNRLDAITMGEDAEALKFTTTVVRPAVNQIKELQKEADELNDALAKLTAQDPPNHAAIAEQKAKIEQIAVKIDKIDKEWKQQYADFLEPLYKESKLAYGEFNALKQQQSDDFFDATTKAQAQLMKIAIADAESGKHKTEPLRTAPNSTTQNNDAKQPVATSNTDSKNDLDQKYLQDQIKNQGDSKKLEELKRQYEQDLREVTSKFYGEAGDKYYGPDPEFAKDYVKRVQTYPDIKFDLPVSIPKVTRFRPDKDPHFWDEFGGNSTAPQLRHMNEPNPYAMATGEYESGLREAIMKSGGNLTPADIIEMSLKQTDGNYALAVLTAHNLLKQVTKDGRDQSSKLEDLRKFGHFNLQSPNVADTFHQFQTNAEFADKLANMRNGPGDKMGIWYHAFAVLGMEVVTDSAKMAELLAAGEQVMRTGNYYVKGESESPVDPIKRVSDFHFAHANHDIYGTAHPIGSKIDSILTPINPGRMVTHWYDVYDDSAGHMSNYGHGGHAVPTTGGNNPGKPPGQPVETNLQPAGGSNDPPGAPH